MAFLNGDVPDLGIVVDIQAYSEHYNIHSDTQNQLHEALAGKAISFILNGYYLIEPTCPAHRTFADKVAFFNTKLNEYQLDRLKWMLPQMPLSLLPTGADQALMEQYGLIIQEDNTLNIALDTPIEAETLSAVLITMCEGNVSDLDSGFAEQLRVFAKEHYNNCYINQWGTVSRCLMSNHPQNMLKVLTTLQLNNDLCDVIKSNSTLNSTANFSTSLFKDSMLIALEYMAHNQLTLPQRLAVLLHVMAEYKENNQIQHFGGVIPQQYHEFVLMCLGMSVYFDTKPSLSTMEIRYQLLKNNVLEQNIDYQLFESLKGKCSTALLKDYVPVFKCFHEVLTHIHFMDDSAYNVTPLSNNLIDKMAEYYTAIIELVESGIDVEEAINIKEPMAKRISQICYDVRNTLSIFEMFNVLWQLSNENQQTHYIYNGHDFDVSLETQTRFWISLLALPNVQVFKFGLNNMDLFCNSYIYANNAYILHKKDEHLDENTCNFIEIRRLSDTTNRGI